MDITNTMNLPKAYAYLQISFMLVAIIGPIAGGMLSQPADRFPEIFGCSELLKTYPYLLSCTVSVVCASIAWLVTCFCLKEGWFSSQSYTKPSMTLSNAPASCGGANPEGISLTPLLLHDVLTPKVLIVTASNGTLILFDITWYSILAIFYATPIELGGLSLDPPHIGTIFAISSSITFTFQILFYT
ncbi:hypothetical protein BDR04DRAFT_1202560 [Suillus decipiens]|nr:hypothetical protein BDR04DRAFT_1202560 [Suillus decipiens]